MSIYIILVLFLVLVSVLVIVILLHVDSVLVLVIVSKISLSTAILFYALVYGVDDEDDAGLSSGAGTNLKVGDTCQARIAEKNFCRACYVLCSGNYGYSNEKPDCRYKSINISKYTVHQYFSTSTRIHTRYCLLYTSPSPRDRQKSRMPSSA